jgi:hypothetical protein
MSSLRIQKAVAKEERLTTLYRLPVRRQQQLNDIFALFASAVFQILLFLGVFLGWIPLLVLGLINNNRNATDSNVTVTGIPTSDNVTLTGIPTSDNVTVTAAMGMIIGGSIWGFLFVGLPLVSFGKYPLLSLCAHKSID